MAKYKSKVSTQQQYQAARAKAQAEANTRGQDIGIWWNDIFGEWIQRGLPAYEFRRGHELQCEVVSPENLSTCSEGHGPMARTGQDEWPLG